MKRNLKGFTLVELIIVMAILTILMAAVMQMFKPIRSTYVDSTLYEAQRTSQNGIVKYIGESVRYSTDLGIYTSDNASSVTAAVDEFTKAYLRANGVYSSTDVSKPEYMGKNVDPDYSDKYTKTLEKMKRTAEVIIIDNETVFPYNNVGCKGRVLRRKFEDNTSYNSSSDPEYKKYKEITNDAEDYTKKDSCRLALSAPYYGDKTYWITFRNGDSTKNVSDPWKADDGIAITVASWTKNNAALAAANVGYIETNGEVVCKNQCTPINGMFDVSGFTDSAQTLQNVYIVYTDKKVTIEK